MTAVLPEAASPPRLRITVEGAEAVGCAASPTLRFLLRIDGDGDVRSVLLTTRIRIAAPRRTHTAEEKERLAELFGPPAEWGRTLHALEWAQTVTQVPPFTGSTVTAVDVPCTYDFDVAATKYLHCLADGEVPLEFLFTGTVFYEADGRLLAARIPHGTGAEHRMPVRVWRDVMDRYFPSSAWLRLSREVFDRLYAYRVRHTLLSWDETVDALLRAGGE